MRFGWKKSIAFLTLIVLFCGAAPRVSAQNWTAEDKDIWKKAIKRVVTTPPCCGACSLVDMEQGRKAYRYITGEDRSAEAEKIYNDHAKKFLDAFRYFSASRYDYWFGPSKEGSNEK